jgi:hypothetical protein
MCNSNVDLQKKLLRKDSLYIKANYIYSVTINKYRPSS